MTESARNAALNTPDLDQCLWPACRLARLIGR